MKITFRILKTVFLLIWVLPTFGQSHLLLPGRGIEGIPVILDSSNISNVIEQFGNDYSITTTTLVTFYKYNQKGLTFLIDPYDKNQIIRSIYVEFPFQAQTNNGIILNESTMNDVWKLYNEKGYFTSEVYALHTQKGISFYIKNDPNKKNIYPKEKICKIEIHNKGRFGMPSRVNFQFNDEPVKRKLEELIAILKADSLDFKKLDTFWQIQKLTEKEPYGLEKAINFERKIEYDLTQEYTDIKMVRSNYNLNIIKSYGDLIYMRLSSQGEGQVVFERNEIAKISDRLNQNERQSDTSTVLNYPFIVYTYGTFCGFRGMPPALCLLMLNLVRENKYEELAKWLYSINPEVATYGYVGLDFLKRNGKNIAFAELKRMNELSKSDIMLNTCKGCNYNVTEKMSEVLKENNLKDMYKLFKQTHWVK